MTYSQALQTMDRLRERGIRPGLSRMEEAAERLGHPEKTFRAIHIAGTNGKGSTAAMIAAAMTASGHRVGLFTSPAVTDIRDTVQINGEPISQEAFAAAATEVCDAMPDGLTEFEWLTTVCFTAFRQNGVTLAVVECGLGGTHDATNILPPPLCAVFTPIGLDHTNLLGETVTAIAEEKCGIIKHGCAVVCAPLLDPDALAVIYSRAASVGAQIHQPTTAPFADPMPPFAMRGQHQHYNAATAHAVLLCLQTQGLSVDFDAALTAMSRVSLPCRVEVLDTTPPLLLDGAHNPHGVAALCEQLKAHAPVICILGMLADKDHRGVIEQIAPLCRRLICCTPQHTPRPALPAEQLAEIARDYHGDVVVIDDPSDAWTYAKNAPDTALVAAGGSFYTAAAVRRAALSSDSE